MVFRTLKAVLLMTLACGYLASQNLLRNSDFEDVDARRNFFSHWTGDRNAIASSPDAYSGRTAAIVTGKLAPQTAHWITGLNQTVPITPSPHRLELFVKLQGDGHVFASWNFQDAQRRNIPVKHYWTTQKSRHDGSWQRISQHIDVPPETAYLSLGIYYKLADTDVRGQAYLDRVSLTPILPDEAKNLPEGAQLVYHSRLDASDLATNWEIKGGKWSLAAGNAVKGTGPNGILAFKRPLHSPNLRLEYTAWSDDPGDLSAYLGAKENASAQATGYFFGFGSGNNTINRISRGNQTFAMLGGQWDSLSDSIRPGTRHRVVVQRNNEQLSMTIDGKEVLKGNDPLFNEVAKGACSLYVWRSGSFSDIRIYELPSSHRGLSETKVEHVKIYDFNHLKGISCQGKAELSLVNVPTYVMKASAERQKLHARNVKAEEIGSRRVADNALSVKAKSAFTLSIPVTPTASGIVEFDFLAQDYGRLDVRLLDATGKTLRSFQIKANGAFECEGRALRQKIRWLRRRYDAPLAFTTHRWHTFRLRYNSENGTGETSIMDYFMEIKGAGWPEGNYGDIIILDSTPGYAGKAVANTLQITGKGRCDVLLDNLVAFGPIGYSKVNGKPIIQPARKLLDLDYPMRRDPIRLHHFSIRGFPDTSGPVNLGFQTQASWLYLVKENKHQELFQQAADAYDRNLIRHAFLRERTNMMNRTALYRQNPALETLVQKTRERLLETEEKLQRALEIYADAWWNDWNLTDLNKIYPVCRDLEQDLSEISTQLDHALSTLPGGKNMLPCPTPMPNGTVKWDPEKRFWTQGGKITALPYTMQIFPGYENAMTMLGFPLCKRNWFGNVCLRLNSDTPGEYINRNFHTYNIVKKHPQGYYSISTTEGVHYVNGYAPSWWYDKHKADPDIHFCDAEGKQYTDMHKSNQSRFLNYWHPEVRKMMEDKYDHFGKLVKRLPNALWIIHGMELKNQLPNMAHPGYNHNAIKIFQNKLKDKYKTIKNLNQAWQATYRDFEEIKPPSDQNTKPSGLLYEFNRFYQEAFAQWLNTTRKTIAKHTKIPFINDQQETFGGHVGIEPISYIRALDVKMYHTYQAWDRKLVARWHHQITTALNRRFGTLEWTPTQGIGDMFDYDVNAISTSRELFNQVMWGAAVMNTLYYFPYNNWQNGLCALEPTLDYSILTYSGGNLAVDHDRIRRFSEIAMTAQTLKPAIGIIECTPSYYNQLPVRNTMITISSRMADESMDMEILYDQLITEGRQSLKGIEVLWLPEAGCMTKDFCRLLYDWIRNGGTAIAVGKIPGIMDENGRTNPECPFVQENNKGNWERQLGKGRLIFAEKLPRNFLSWQKPYTSKRFGSPNRELLFRRCQRQGKQLLFAQNWAMAPCEADLFVEGDFTRIVDRGLQVPVTVPLRHEGGKTWFKTRLAPGDGTLFELIK